MVPPKNGFLSLRLPIFGASYFHCFYTRGMAPWDCVMLMVEMGSVMTCSTVTRHLTVILDFVIELSLDVLSWDDSQCLPTH